MIILAEYNIPSATVWIKKTAMSIALQCPHCLETFASGRQLRQHFAAASACGSNKQRVRQKRERPDQKKSELHDDAVVDGNSPAMADQVVQRGSKSARSSRLKEEDARVAASTSLSAGPVAGTSSTDLSVQSKELDKLIGWGDTATRTLLNDVKAATIEHHNERASKFSAWLEEKLRAVGVTDSSTLEEISSAVATEMQPWQGLQTTAAEQRVRKQLYPHIQPIRRSLIKPDGKSKYATEADGEQRFVYDMPVEEHVQQRWNLRPQEFSRSREYLRQQQQRQQHAIVDDNWLVDDYYSSLNGLAHPHLGKSNSYLGACVVACAAAAAADTTHCGQQFMCIAGFASYGDGIDAVKNALGIFAGSKSVVVFMSVLLFLPPVERLQLHNLHVSTVAYASDCKTYGYEMVLSGNPADLECTSIGGSMRRLELGCEFNTDEGVVVLTGGLVALKGDNPMVSGLLATKESFGDTVKSPCDQCMVKGAEYNDLDLNKSFLDSSDPPCELKTSTWYAERIAEVNAFKGSVAARDKKAAEYGLNLNTDGSACMHTGYHSIPHLKDVCYDYRSVEIAHDGLLGAWPQQVYQNLFFYTRDKSNANYFGLEALQARFSEYNWRGASRCASKFHGGH